MWIFTDGSVPDAVMSELCLHSVHFVDVSQFQITSRMSWRFLIASEPVKMFEIRDIDGLMLARDKAAVDEWIKSGRKFHVLRDNPNHSRYPMSGGMWGGRRDSIPNMKQMVEKAAKNDYYMADMDFLNGDIWNIVKNSVWAHDSYSLHKFGEDHPFPTERENGEFVGSADFS